MNVINDLVVLFVILFLIAWALLPYARKRHEIYRWRQALNLDEIHAVFQSLYQDIDGFSVSQSARQNQDAMEYTYGEIDFTAFIALLSLTNPNQDTHFYDLGSGTGKAVMACAMVFDVASCYGIELLQPLHETALMQKQQLHANPKFTAKAEKIHCIHGDYLTKDFSQATLIFINATALFGDSWEQLNDVLTKTATRATVITTSKTLSSPAFTLNQKTRVQMSWGIITAYIHYPLP